jgi:rare lipoprotein A (peptidoglycan hydrolase)
MLMRKLGLTAFLIVALAGVAEAKHSGRHSRHSTQATEHSGGGLASVYGSSRDGYAGGRTASGERVHSGALTAAHRLL